jgi:hypothetical protein
MKTGGGEPAAAVRATPEDATVRIRAPAAMANRRAIVLKVSTWKRMAWFPVS